MIGYVRNSTTTAVAEMVAKACISHKIELPPQPVGNYKVDRYLGFTLTKKPKWFHRKMVELILGWKWEDAK